MACITIELSSEKNQMRNALCFVWVLRREGGIHLHDSACPRQVDAW